MPYSASDSGIVCACAASVASAMSSTMGAATASATSGFSTGACVAGPRVGISAGAGAGGMSASSLAASAAGAAGGAGIGEAESTSSNDGNTSSSPVRSGVGAIGSSVSSGVCPVIISAGAGVGAEDAARMFTTALGTRRRVSSGRIMTDDSPGAVKRRTRRYTRPVNADTSESFTPARAMRPSVDEISV